MAERSLFETSREAERAPGPVGLDATRFAVVLGLFGVSGGAGLVDQVCFSKYFSYVVGATAYAVSAVLAAFMAGITLGAFLGGKLSQRVRRPLLAYGVVELVVAGTVVLAPLAFAWLTPVYVELARGAEGSIASVSVLRWALAMLIVVVPTTAMGTTLPLLAPALGFGSGGSAEGTRQRRLGGLYAANTLGGAVGSLGAAYFALPWLGLSGTLYAAAGLSALAGLTALAVGGGLVLEAPTAKPAANPESPAAAPVDSERVLLGALAYASGALVFIAEVVGTHLLAVIIGNSAYAFGLILAVFLVCLFFGAALAGFMNRRFGSSALSVGLGASALAWTLTLPLWDRMPFLFSGLGGYVTSFEAREAVRALVAFAILFIPTTLSGLTFPLLLQRVAGEADVGRLVGRLTAINTIGAVTGALLTGYVILPLLGSQHSLLLVALVFALAAVLSGGTRARPGRGGWVLAGAAVAVGLLSPRWDLARLTAGTNVYFEGYEAPDEVIFMREDVHGGVTTVTKTGPVKTLYTNGKFQGNDGWEMHAQRLFTHYPTLFVKGFERSLVIGMGTATTLGAYAAYPWKSIDVVEISPSIAEAAATHFQGPNRGALADPRVAVHFDDGRNFLLVHEDTYDLIGMELSSVWFAGASALYSREYYALVSQHLKPGAVFQQWVQLHHMRHPVFATILNTLRDEFEHVILFYGGRQGILVASHQPLVTTEATLADRGGIPTVRATLPAGRPLTSLFDDILVMNAGIDRFLADVAAKNGLDRASMLSTDDNLYLEYETPRGNVLPWQTQDELSALLRSYRDPSEVAALVASR